MRLSTCLRFLAAVVVAAAPAAAQAQFTVYTDLASFLAATSNPGTDSFDDLAAGSLASPLSRSAGTHGYAASTNTLGFYVTGSGADRWLSTDVENDIVTFSGFGPTVRGIGAFFFGTDAGGAFRPGTSLTLRATGAGGTTVRTLSDATLDSFLGFVATDAVTSLTVQTVQPPNDLAWPTVNGLVLADAAVATPEPATAALLGAGVLALGLVSVRRPRR